MSTAKSAGATKLGRDSRPKYLGVKKFSGEKVNIGSIIIRQRGTKFLPGKNVKIGSDNTIYAIKEGVVKFTTKNKVCFNGLRREAKVVNVETSN